MAWLNTLSFLINFPWLSPKLHSWIFSGYFSLVLLSILFLCWPYFYLTSFTHLNWAILFIPMSSVTVCGLMLPKPISSACCLSWTSVYTPHPTAYLISNLDVCFVTEKSTYPKYFLQLLSRFMLLSKPPTTLISKTSPSTFCAISLTLLNFNHLFFFCFFLFISLSHTLHHHCLLLD